MCFLNSGGNMKPNNKSLLPTAVWRKNGYIAFSMFWLVRKFSDLSNIRLF